MRSSQMGLSLIELLVVVVLALLLSLVMVGVYRAGFDGMVRAQNIAMLMDQDVSTVTMNEQLRLAGSGVGLFTQIQPSAVITQPTQIAMLKFQGLSSKWLSQSRHADEPPHLSQLPSDQLTIWYVAPMDLWDCEGDLALGPRKARLKDGTMAMIDGQVVIERYFVQAESDGSLSLRCDAAHFVTDVIDRDGTRDRRGVGASFMTAIIDSAVSGRGAVTQPWVLKDGNTAGEIILPNIDGFWVQLLVGSQAQSSQVAQMRIHEYQSQADGQPILGVQYAIISRASLAQQGVQAAPIKIFDQTISPPDDQLPRRLHTASLYFDSVVMP